MLKRCGLFGLGCLAALAFVLGISAPDRADARDARGTIRNASFEVQAQAVLAGATSGAEAAMIDVGCCKDVPKCCDTPCIRYAYRRCHRVCCGCEPPTKVVLKVKDPCCCCYIEVPICLPACCKGEPSVCSRCGILGRGVVEYSWCCGFRVHVVINKCGDVRVTYIGA